jgi:hypothetical protein
MTLTIEIATNFSVGHDFITICESRNTAPVGVAVYVLWTSVAFNRLHGQSQVLYIGSTTTLGGSGDRTRLYAYRYPGDDQRRRVSNGVKKWLDLNAGQTVFIRWCQTFPNGMTHNAYESFLLEMTVQDHLELPPFNHRL